MKYEIIESGSKGNAVIFNDIVMVDCGIAFKKLIPYYKNLQLVLLTHIHSDHFNKATIKRLAKERPTLRWGCPAWLLVPLVECGVKTKNIDFLCLGGTYQYAFGTVLSFFLHHDVDNCGYKITLNTEESIVYATDTCSLPDLPNCDYYFVESNYKNTDELAERMRAKLELGDFAYEKRVADYHMSEEYVLNWLVKNGKPDSKHVFLHEHEEKGEKRVDYYAN
jgi:hypothetical protein